MGAGIADHDGAAVVLQRGGDDFRGRGAGPVHEHDERLAERDRGIVVRQGQRAARFADHDDGAGAEEEPREVHGVGQRAAAVAAEVEDEPLDALLVEAGDELRDVRGGAALLALGGAGALHRSVERREADVAHAALGAGGVLHGVHARKRGLVLELDLVADERDDLDAARIGGGDDAQADGRALGAADEADGLVERPVADVGEFPVLALRHGDDPVAADEAFGRLVALGRRAGDDLDDLGGAVVHLELRADALERELHVDAEIFGRRGREVVGVGVAGRREGVEGARGPELLVRVAEDVEVAGGGAREVVAGGVHGRDRAGEGGGGVRRGQERSVGGRAVLAEGDARRFGAGHEPGGGGLPGDARGEEGVFRAGVPERVGLRAGGRERGVVPVPAEFAAGGPVDFVRDRGGGVGGAVFDAPEQHVERLLREGEVAGGDAAGVVGAEPGEGLRVLAREERVLRIERIDEIRPGPGGKGGVERRMLHVEVGQELGDRGSRAGGGRGVERRAPPGDGLVGAERVFPLLARGIRQGGERQGGGRGEGCVQCVAGFHGPSENRLDVPEYTRNRGSSNAGPRRVLTFA